MSDKSDKDVTVETVSVRLDRRAKELLDAYHNKRPALSRGACFIQMLYDLAWHAEEGGKTARLKRIEETLAEHGALLHLLCDKLSIEVPLGDEIEV